MPMEGHLWNRTWPVPSPTDLPYVCKRRWSRRKMKNPPKCPSEGERRWFLFPKLPSLAQIRDALRGFCIQCPPAILEICGLPYPARETETVIPKWIILLLPLIENESNSWDDFRLLSESLNPLFGFRGLHFSHLYSVVESSTDLICGLCGASSLGGTASTESGLLLSCHL